MIQKYTAGNGANLAIAEQHSKTGKIILGVFVGGVALVALGAGTAYMALGGAEEAGPPSTAQQIALLTAPEPEPTHLVASERRGLRYQPAQETTVLPPAAAPEAPVTIAAAPPPAEDLPVPDLEQMVSRSIGALATDPIGLQPPAEAPAVAEVQTVAATPAVAPPVPAQISPTELFTAPAATADNRCIEDLRALAQDARVYFPSGGLTLDEQGIVQARVIGFVAQDCPGVMVQVEGHSDSSGDPAANLRLSEERARAVILRLAAAGVDTTRFQAVGFGDQRPSAISGSEPAAYYDRRVEFSVIETGQPAAFTLASASAPASFLPAQPACVAQLQQAVAQTRLFFEPRSITVPQSELSQVYQLAAAVAACPQVRLRIVGQFSDDPGSGETPDTARLRAIALMSTLVASGFEQERIIIVSPSSPTALANAPGISERRIDFDLILDEV